MFNQVCRRILGMHRRWLCEFAHGCSSIPLYIYTRHFCRTPSVFGRYSST